MEHKEPPPKPPAPKAVVLVGKGPPPAPGKAGGGPPGAKLALHGSGPPPGKVAVPKPATSGPPTASNKPALPGSLPKKPLAPGGEPPPPPPATTNGLKKNALPKPALESAKKQLPKPPVPSKGAKVEGGPPPNSLLPPGSPASPSKGPLQKALGNSKLPTPGLPPAPRGPPGPASPKPAEPTPKGALGEQPASVPVKDPAGEGPKVVLNPPASLPPAAKKGLPTSLQPKGTDGFSLPKGATPTKALKDPSSKSGVEGSLKASSKQGPHVSEVISSEPPIAASGPSLSLQGASSAAKAGQLPEGGAGAQKAPPQPKNSSVDEFGRPRGSVGDLAPRSELTQELLNSTFPVFDKAGNFVAYASGPASPLSRSDPSRRLSVSCKAKIMYLQLRMRPCVFEARRLADRKPQERDIMKGALERGALAPGAFGGVSVAGGIPGFFLSVPPWPAPMPMPMDQLGGWGTYPQFGNYPAPQISPYAAYPTLPVAPPQYPYPLDSQGDIQRTAASQQQGPLQGSQWPSYPLSQETVPLARASNTSGAPALAAVDSSAKEEGRRHRRSSGGLSASEEAAPRGYRMEHGEEDVGKTKWLPVERHLNNIRGGYGEAYRPPEESMDPPKKLSSRARNRHSSARDDVYSGFRPYYVRDKKPYVDEMVHRSGQPREPSGGYPVAPTKSSFMTKPRERTWDRWGRTGLIAPRNCVEHIVCKGSGQTAWVFLLRSRRTYQSLSELASCFSNLEPDDQDDIISLLLLCRKLEQQVEKQHVVIDMLEHDLSEAQKVLKFPPEWRSLKDVDFAGMVPSDTPFQATAATPLYLKNISYLPSVIPDNPNANFGVGVPLTSQSKPTPEGIPAPSNATGAAPPSGAATPKAAPAAADTPKKPPATMGVKFKGPSLGMKKPVFKKM